MSDEDIRDSAVERLVRATNAHDIEGIVACFADDYTLDAPLHPARSFRGREQVRRNWTQILGAVPDLAVRLLRVAADGAAVVRTIRWCDAVAEESTEESGAGWAAHPGRAGGDRLPAGGRDRGTRDRPGVGP